MIHAGGGFQGVNNSVQRTPIDIAPLKLERLNTYEVGYKGTFKDKMVVYVNYFRSYYNDFIGAQRFIGNRDGSRPTLAQLTTESGKAQPFQDATSPTRILQVWTNARQEVRTYGAALGLSYSVARPLTLTANYSLNVLDKSNLPEGFLEDHESLGLSREEVDTVMCTHLHFDHAGSLDVGQLGRSGLLVADAAV